ncbi:cell division protein CrgA [Mycetocola reblochoni]|uniref:Cell division protein CrgA n=2 Tax=Mycetocola reblochoni TaxID=331618 RepID=A0A1R4JFR5_9MICO|nr:cell division protein CrgA [Mycetocola reblochoni]RLP67727.1 cell division protein CrgA [Mycetocola reblochoni]SJN30857.1 Cell division protein CrgA [Mycetocola reblochoni REB411]
MARTKRQKPADVDTPSSGEQAPNAVWFKPVMFGFLLLGLVWIIVYYISAGTLPIPAIDVWNLAIGFGIAFIGFIMATRWR